MRSALSCLLFAMVACSGDPDSNPGSPEQGVSEMPPPTLVAQEPAPVEPPQPEPLPPTVGVKPPMQDTLPDEPADESPPAETPRPEEPAPQPVEENPPPAPATGGAPATDPDPPASAGAGGGEPVVVVPPDPLTCGDMAPDFDGRPYMFAEPVVCVDAPCEGGASHPAVCDEFDFINDSPLQLSGNAYERQLSVFTDRLPDLQLSEVCAMTVFPEKWEHGGCQVWKVPRGSTALIQQRWKSTPGWAHVVVSFRGSDRACPLSCAE